MTSTRLKKGLLAVLLIVAGYIWWGNIQFFTQSDASSMMEPDGGSEISTEPVAATVVPAWEPPRVNPFQRITYSTAPPDRPRAPAPPKPELPPEYGLTGFLQRGNQSQAVIRIGQGGSTVLSIGDSLGAWQLVNVIDQAAILLNEKTYDTLRLETPVQQ